MHWLIVARDKPGQGAIRQKTREAHRAYIWRSDLSARLLVGSPLADDSGAAMTGTWLLVAAPDRAAVEAFTQEDPYNRAGIFERVEIAALHAVFDPSRFGLQLQGDAKPESQKP